MMKGYKPPKDDPFADVLSDSVLENEEHIGQDQELKHFIYRNWIDLHATTRDNLERFETPGYSLSSSAIGLEEVSKLVGCGTVPQNFSEGFFVIMQLAELNDIVRLCHRFKLPFDMEFPLWPLLTVEFNSLRDKKVEGIFEASSFFHLRIRL
jgi:hypothetical protein